MPTNLSVDQIVEAVNQLSAADRQKLIDRLFFRSAKLDRIHKIARPKFLAMCRERGVDFEALNEEEREKFIDDLLHED
jgi:hypothetical protein